MTWVQVGPVSGSTGVDGSSAYAILPSGDGVLETATGGPWIAPAGFTMTVTARATPIPTTSHSVDFDFELFSAGSAYLADLYISVTSLLGGGQINLNDVSSVSADFTAFGADAPFYVKWERVPGGVSRAKIWDVGDAEPDWMVASTAPATLPVDLTIDLENNQSSGSSTQHVDSIVFDSGGSGMQPGTVGGGATTDDTLSGGPLGSGIGRA